MMRLFTICEKEKKNEKSEREGKGQRAREERKIYGVSGIPQFMLRLTKAMTLLMNSWTGSGCEQMMG